MKFGFHISIAGGLSRVCARAENLQCETIQIFTRSPRAWKLTPLDEYEVNSFVQNIRDSGIAPVFVHAPYLPNLAGSDVVRSVDAIVADAQRCYRLKVNYLIVHVGRAKGASQIQAIRRVAQNINRVLERMPESVMLLLENTAGMGSEIGYRFEHIRDIMEQLEDSDRVGVVLDTAHLFEAGYDLRTKKGLDETLSCFDRTVGMSRLRLLHLNDSVTELGSRIDRHWHIGKGRIGLRGFRGVVNHTLLRRLPGIMETPRKSYMDDISNMKTIRSLVK